MISAAVDSGTLRNIRRKSGSFTRSRWRRAIVCVAAIGGFFVLNWIYQAIRKPGEILAPISASLSKSPESTWESYGPLFEKYSTSILSAELLAAIAQVEGNGNPIARTYWRWRWSWNPFDIYRPASTAVGMFQITDGTFAEARKYCIRDHQVVTDGPWHDPRSCWFNSLYTRTLASHSTEMTAGYLHRSVVNTLPSHGVRVSLAQKQKLAAVIHLCGLKRGEAFIGRGFRAASGERCGAHSLGRYLVQVDLMKRRFARLRKGNELSEPARHLSRISVSARFNGSKGNSTP